MTACPPGAAPAPRLAKTPDLGVVIVNYRTPALTLAAVASLKPGGAAFPGLRVVVVDGGSADRARRRRLRKVSMPGGWGRGDVVVPLLVNGGFAFADDRAIAALAWPGRCASLVALLNPDARVRPGALEAMAALLVCAEAGAAVRSARCWGMTMVRPQSSASRFPSIRSKFCRGPRTAAG